MRERKRHRQSFNIPGHAHELTFGCFHGFDFLSKQRTCEWLAESIDNARRKLGFSLWAYVFMPNHVHLIVHSARADYDIAEWLKEIKLPVSRKAIAHLRRYSPAWLERIKQVRGKRTEYHFWQRGGGYDRNITDPTTLEKMIEYLHLNPVRKELVIRAVDWHWSSARWFAGLESNCLRPDRIPPEWTIGMSNS
jgi:putative transposase